MTLEGGIEEAVSEVLPRDFSQKVDHANAIPVRIVREPGEKIQAAEHSGITTVVLTGNEPPFQLLSFDRHRSKATIIIQPNAAGTQVVRLAKQEQVSNNGGGLIQAPQSVTYSAAPNLWVIPQAANGAVIITVIEERYASERA